jgi:hypothetical protein
MDYYLFRLNDIRLSPFIFGFWKLTIKIKNFNGICLRI